MSDDRVKKLDKLKEIIKNPDYIKIIDKKIKIIKEDKTITKDGN